MFPREEGHDRARIASLIAEIEVIGAGIVEIHSLLDEALAENPGVEIEIAAGGASNCSDVMNAMCHVNSPLLGQH